MGLRDQPLLPQGLVSYWESEFDWRKQEEQINSYPHFIYDMASNPFVEPNSTTSPRLYGVIGGERRLNIKIEF